jgi:hypothetical protein
MQITVQFPRDEMVEAVAEGMRRGFIQALASSDRDDHELICNAIREGVTEAFSKMLSNGFADDLLERAPT